MNDDHERREWRWVAGGTMTALVIVLFLVAAAADTFLSRFMPVFLGLMLVALALYTLVVGSVRLVQRLRRPAATPPASPTRPGEGPR